MPSATVVIPTEFGRPGEGGHGTNVSNSSSYGAGNGATVSASGTVSQPQPVILSVPDSPVIPDEVQSVVGATREGDQATQNFAAASIAPRSASVSFPCRNRKA